MSDIILFFSVFIPLKTYKMICTHVGHVIKNKIELYELNNRLKE